MSQPQPQLRPVPAEPAIVVPPSKIDQYFQISERGSTQRREIVAGITTFLAMVYSVFVVPGMLGQAGFDVSAVFVAVCLTAAVGSLLMGLWARLPIAVGCAISLTAFTAFGLVLGKGLSPAIALGAVFLMGLVFTAISVTGVRSWILQNLPSGVAHGTGVGIGLFLLMIASSDVGLVVKNAGAGLPVALGHVTAFPVVMSMLGLAAIFGLEQRKVPGGILLVVIAISALGLAFDPAVHFTGFFAMPKLSAPGHASLIGAMDIRGALSMTVLPSVLALVMTAVFDATGTIRAVAGQAGQVDAKGYIHNGGKALTADSLSSIFAALVGGAPAAAYIESTVGTAAGAPHRPDRRGGRRAVPRPDFLLAAGRPGAVVCDRAGADVRRPADAGQRRPHEDGRQDRCPVRPGLRRVHPAHLQYRHRHHARLLHAGGRPPGGRRMAQAQRRHRVHRRRAGFVLRRRLGHLIRSQSSALATSAANCSTPIGLLM